MQPHEIIKRAIITEKTAQLQEKYNRYCFEVDRRANKLQIKEAVEKLFGVRVVKVNTLVVPGKRRRRYLHGGRQIVVGKTRAYKKAYVTLARGDTIEVLNLKV